MTISHTGTLLPDSAEDGVIYLVPHDQYDDSFSDPFNHYDKYVAIDGMWEKLNGVNQPVHVYCKTQNLTPNVTRFREGDADGNLLYDDPGVLYPYVAKFDGTLYFVAASDNHIIMDTNQFYNDHYDIYMVGKTYDGSGYSSSPRWIKVFEYPVLSQPSDFTSEEVAALKELLNIPKAEGVSF